MNHSPPAPLRRAVFLDRDGTLNEERGFLYKISDFTFCAGVIDGLRRLQQADLFLVVVTNQSGIARGYYSESDLAILHEWMHNELQSLGIELGGVFYCPHLPGASLPNYDRQCTCRKPQPGMLLEAAMRHSLDLASSYLIGDRETDIEAGHNAGVTPILLGSDPTSKALFQAARFENAVEYIIGKINKTNDK